MFKRLLMLLGLLVAWPVQARQSFTSADDFLNALTEAANTGGRTLDTFWQAQIDAAQIPFVIGDTAVFAYRGEAESVDWRGDFTGWDTSSDFQGQRIGTSDVWFMRAQFPTDARLDYKIVVNGSNWILDPANAHQQYGGFGPNSELRMPDYIYPETTIPREDIQHGSLSPVITKFSDALGYAVNYRVYRPVGYPDVTDMPSIYITDGQEYADSNLGSMVTVLDNLIADGKIKPVLAVFVDPRNPKNSNENRREAEYVENPDYAQFLAEELVPLIDALYKTNQSAATRAVLGTSLGGLNAAYTGITYPDVFGLVGIQSPAFWISTDGHIYDLWDEAETLPQKIYLTNGNYAWDAAQTDIEPMTTIFAAKNIPFTYTQVNEGHSWGNWRALLDDILLNFFPI